MGDEGSGFSIGLEALRAIMRAYDGRGKKTLLSKNILENLGLSSEIELSNWIYNEANTKDLIANLSYIVC